MATEKELAERADFIFADLTTRRMKAVPGSHSTWERETRAVEGRTWQGDGDKTFVLDRVTAIHRPECDQDHPHYMTIQLGAGE